MKQNEIYKKSTPETTRAPYIDHTGSRPQTTPSYSPLERSKEIEMTRHIKELELELWIAILKNRSKIRFVAEKIAPLILDSKEREESKLTANILETLCHHTDQTTKTNLLATYEERVNELADKLRQLDQDREIAREATKEIISRCTIRKSSGELHLSNQAKLIRKISDSLNAAKDAFIEANQGLVVLIAGRYTWPKMSLNDLIQEGNLGLIKAVNRFDFEKGYQFSTYASWWIQSAIGRAIDNKESMIRIPSSALRNRSRFKRAVRNIKLQTGRTPTQGEIQAETGMGRLRLERAQKHAITHIFSLDQTVSDTNNLRYVDVLIDENSSSPYEETLMGTLTKEMALHLSTLSPLERSILNRRFGLEDTDELTLQEIADQYGLSRERIRQIQNRALEKLRHKMALDAA